MLDLTIKSDLNGLKLFMNTIRLKIHMCKILIYFKAKQRSFFTLSMISLLTACNNDRHNHPELNTGKELFEHHCARCHQKNGLGKFLKGVPANIATTKNQPEIVWHIQQGSQSGQSRMPVYSNMPTDEANKIAHYLLILKRNYYNSPKNSEKFLLKRKP